MGSFYGLKLFDRSSDFSRFLPDRLPGEDDVACVPPKPPSYFRHQRSPPEVIKGRPSTHREAPLVDSAEQQEAEGVTLPLVPETDHRRAHREHAGSWSHSPLMFPLG